MPAPEIVGTMFFSQGFGTRKAGWSETDYILGAAGAKEALVTLGLLATKRAAILGAGVSISYLRTSDIAVDRDSQVAKGPQPGALNPPLVVRAGTKLEDASQTMYNQSLRQDAAAVADPVSIFCDFPWTALLIRMEADSPFVQRRSKWLRGNPDYITSVTSDLPQPGQYAQALQEFANTLCNGKYGFRAVDVSNANPLMPLVGFNTAGLNLIVTIQDGKPVPIKGEDVRIEGNVLLDQYGNKYKLNGKYTVKDVAGQVVTFFQPPPPLPSFTVKKPGNIRPQRKVVIPYKNAVLRRWGKKATGGPFDPLHGRVKAK